MLNAAHAQGRPQTYPVKLRKLKRSRREHAWLWLQWGEQVWLQQRPDTGVWAGLLSLPEFADVAALQAALAPWPGECETLPPLVHVLTHFDWHLQPVRWTLPKRLGAARRQALQALLGPGRWATVEEALTLGVPAPLRRLLSA